MGATGKEFENFEQQFVELISEFQSLSTSEKQLREALRHEATRAEAAEAARDAAERGAAEACANAAAATTGATQATKALAIAQDELIAVKMQFDFSERQRVLLEEKCTESLNKLSSLEKEIQLLRPLQSTHSNLQRQYVDLQECVQKATEEARSEASRLEAELRRVERCASAGSELRERARLAAAAHARERRLAAADLRHTAHDLRNANAEIARMGIKITELQCRLSKQCEQPSTELKNTDSETVLELKAVLEAERTGAARLERALASAIAENTNLAAQLHINDNTSPENNQTQPIEESKHLSSQNICPIDSFLAE